MLADGGPLKKVFFIRHGQSDSNVLWDKGKTKEAKAIHDPGLSERGRRQASRVTQDRALADVLAEANAEGAPVLLVSSPLRRAIQTLSLGLGSWLERRQAEGDPFRIELCPDIQEHGSGDYPCDRGRPTSLLREEFDGKLPGLCLDSLPEGWCEGRSKDFRSEAAVAARLGRFTSWLQRQPEAVVVVVGHQNVFFSLLDADFENGEVRLYSLAAATFGGHAPTMPVGLPLVPLWEAIWPPPPPPRSLVICANPRCGFAVHSSPDFGCFCCFACYEGQPHGHKCERRPPPPGAKKPSPSGDVPVSEADLAKALAALRLRSPASGAQGV